MGFFRFRRSFKIFPGIRWNLNKRGSSLTFGGRGLTHTVSAKGSRTTVGIPGTGISYTTVHGQKGSAQTPSAPMNKMTKAGCLYTAGAVILGIWFLGKIATLGPSSKPTTPTSTNVPVATPLLLKQDTLEAIKPSAQTTTAVRATTASPAPRLAPSTPGVLQTMPSATKIETPTPRLRTAVEIQRTKRFVPPEVVLTQTIGFPVMNSGREVGVGSVERGTKAKVVGMAGDKLLLDYSGRRQSVPIIYTDFLDRVIAEAEK